MNISLRPLLVVLFIAVSATTGCAKECLTWTDPAHSYSVCIPDGWYSRTMPSGALFLCNSPKGACVEPVGGGPSPGHATISVVPVRDVVGAVPKTLDEFAHAVADKETSSHFTAAVSVPGRFTQVSYLAVTQTYSLGARDEVPQIIHLYFAQAGGQMIELVLTFNGGDKRAQFYQATAVQVVLSLRPT